MPVYYKCKLCEGEHPSPIPIDDKRAFESSSMMTVSFRCPVKGESAIYDKTEMDSLLTYIYPDPKERAFWMENLERRVSGE